MARPAATKRWSEPPFSDDVSLARIALVERGTPWKLAARAFGWARSGSGSVLILEGPRGAGKTPLIAAMRTLATQSGIRVLSASGHRRERHSRFGVLVELLDSELGGIEPPSDAPPEPTFGELHRLFRLFRELARQGPVAILVDDADLADDASLRTLLYLIERLDELPLAIVLACESVAGSAPELFRELCRSRRVSHCPLERLSARGTKRRLAKRWPAVPDDLSSEIHRLTAGNAFLIDAVAADIVAGDSATEVGLGDAASARIAEWAMARAAEVNANAPGLLRAAAVLGETCELRHASALADLAPPAAAQTLDRLARVGLIAASEALTFTEPVVAEALRRTQPAGERGNMHLRAARLLAEEGAPEPDVGEQLLAAPRMGDPWVVEALSSAAASALDSAAPRDAVRYLRRALDEPPAKDMRADLAIQLGQVEAVTGEPQAGARLSGVIRHVGDELESSEPVLAAGRTLFALGRPRDALGAFEHGLEHASNASPDLLGRLSAGRETAVWLSDPASRRELPKLPPAATADTAGGRALLALHSFHRALRGEPRDDVRDLAVRALGSGALLDDEGADGVSYYLAVMALAYAEELDRADGALVAAIEDAHSRGSVLGFATASHIRARVMSLRGRLIDAAREARYALAVERHGRRLWLGGARVVLANICIEQGALQEAVQYLDAAERGSGPDDLFGPSLLAARGRLQFFSGDAEAAFDTLRAAGDAAHSAGIVNPVAAGWRADAGLALAEIGDRAGAERLIEEELSLARSFGAPGPIGRALRALASIHPPGPALEILEAALDVLKQSPAELERAHAMADLGGALRRAGRRRAALKVLREALDLAERCGATVLVRGALRETQAAGARPRRAAIHGEDALTTREFQVASLAAEGLSNRKIADQLVVTVKTVEWHLKHVFEKLGVRSRRDLAGRLDSNTQGGNSED